MNSQISFSKVLERMKKELDLLESGIDYLMSYRPQLASTFQIKLKQCKFDVQFIRQVLSEIEKVYVGEEKKEQQEDKYDWVEEFRRIRRAIFEKIKEQKKDKTIPQGGIFKRFFLGGRF